MTGVDPEQTYRVRSLSVPYASVSYVAIDAVWGIDCQPVDYPTKG